MKQGVELICVKLLIGCLHYKHIAYIIVLNACCTLRDGRRMPYAYSVKEYGRASCTYSVFHIIKVKKHRQRQIVSADMLCRDTAVPPACVGCIFRTFVGAYEVCVPEVKKLMVEGVRIRIRAVPL